MCGEPRTAHLQGKVHHPRYGYLMRGSFLLEPSFFGAARINMMAFVLYLRQLRKQPKT